MARALGFPDVVVQGMMSICFLSEMMTRRSGVGWLHGGKLNVNLVNVLWGGEKITAHGMARETTAEAGRVRVELRRLVREGRRHQDDRRHRQCAPLMELRRVELRAPCAAREN